MEKGIPCFLESGNPVLISDGKSEKWRRPLLTVSGYHVVLIDIWLQS